MINELFEKIHTAITTGDFTLLTISLIYVFGILIAIVIAIWGLIKILDLLMRPIYKRGFNKKSPKEKTVIILKRLKRIRNIIVDENTQNAIMQFALKTGVKECTLELYKRPIKQKVDVDLDEIEKIFKGTNFVIKSKNGNRLTIDNRGIRTVSRVGTKIIFGLYSRSASFKDNAEDVNEYIVKMVLRLPPYSNEELIQKAEMYANTNEIVQASKTF
ncbi:hypothetical protein SAMN02745910_04678 [Priestia endophytica DSM 13796]|uniref:Uncharacterized protein n=2 Tax=Priestia endophytica TaxID=135735 RepID=A0A1I6C081_9BACI|nr:hypothetical protein SAMN02745910_04678 [Priestia endophytica DSM 13796]